MSKLTRDQLIATLTRFGREMNKMEFRTRMENHVKERKVQEPGPMMDELENMQKILWAEWDMFPEVSPDEMLDELHNCAQRFPEDKELHRHLTGFCHLVEAILNNLLGVTNPGMMQQHNHGHSHNGQPCHGHGAAAAHQQHHHGHSHNGQPCHGHGHGHGGHGGVPGGMSPEQYQLMMMASQQALDDAERTFLADVQRKIMMGEQPSVEERQKMMVVQSKIMAYVQTMQEFMKANLAAAAAPTGK